MKINKRYAAIFAAILIAAAVLAVLIFSNVRHANSPAVMLSLGERYLLEMEFEQAFVQFLGVIEIDPNNVQAYIGAAEALIGLDRRDEAIEILRLGYERTGNISIAALLASLETQADGANSADSAYEQSPDSDVDNDENEQANINDGEGTGGILTGQQPITLYELYEWGLGASIHDMVGRFGITQAHVDSFFARTNSVPFARGIRNPDLPEIFVKPVDMTVRNELAASMLAEDSSGNIRSIAIHDIPVVSHQEYLLRFRFGMSLLEAVSELAVSNPDFIAAAQDPTLDNLLLYGEPNNEGDRVIAAIWDEPIVTPDGLEQLVSVLITQDRTREVYPAAPYILQIQLNPYWTVYIDFNINGELMSVTMYDLSPMRASSEDSYVASWREAYAELLRTGAFEPESASAGDRFALYDIDGNGIPELFIHADETHTSFLFTFDESLEQVSAGWRGSFQFPASPSLNGVFWSGSFGGHFIDASSGTFEITDFAHFSDGGPQFEIPIIFDDQLYEEWQNPANEVVIIGYDINETNIVTIIMNQ